MKILVVMQTRTGSTRYAGKVLLPLAGQPLFVRQAQRILAARNHFEFVVATTTDAADDAIRECCRSARLDCFSGHRTDLLDRHYRAALDRQADIIVKIPSDCPLIDPGVVDRVIGHYLTHAGEYDYVSNLHPASYPDGNDVELMTMAALETAWLTADKGFEREHTTPFIWERPDRFRLANVVWESGLDYSMTHRFTIDYPEDYVFLEAVYQRLWTPDRPVFTLDDILALLDREPQIYALNAHYRGVNWYRHHLHELTRVNERQTRSV